jgi:hypothetical protein
MKIRQYTFRMGFQSSFLISLSLFVRVNFGFPEYKGSVYVKLRTEKFNTKTLHYVPHSALMTCGKFSEQTATASLWLFVFLMVADCVLCELET